MVFPASPRTRLAAFSLIELSIVITIIALLVGGVVLTRSFIRNAELTTMMNEAKFYNMSFARFQEQYNSIPGDFATASSIWSGATNGDGNGLIRAGTANTVEMYAAFQHLSLAAYIEGSYSGTGAASVLGTNVPRSSVKLVSYLFDHPDTADGGVSADSYYFDGLYGHVLYIGLLGVNGTVRPQGGMMTPAEALGLDTKFDDGMPGLGTVVTPKQSALANCASSDVAASATYATVGNLANTCMFIIKLP